MLPTIKQHLYAPVQIMTASLLGGPVAGCILLALNYQQMDNPDATLKSLLWGTAALVVLLLLNFLVAKEVPLYRLTILFAALMHYTAKKLQGGQYRTHREQGGQRGSWNMTLLVGIACLMGFLMLILFGFIFLDTLLPELMKYSPFR